MNAMSEYPSAETWLDQIFASVEALRGGVILQLVRDVERWAGRAAFLRAAERHGFQVFENGRYFVVFCNAQPIRRLR